MSTREELQKRADDLKQTGMMHRQRAAILRTRKEEKMAKRADSLASDALRHAAVIERQIDDGDFEAPE